jgi:hypothetical protein
MSLESVQQLQDPEISGLTEDQRIELLEKKFDMVTTNFNATLHQITAQQEVTDANFQQLFLLLSRANLGQTNLGSPTVNKPPSTMSGAPHAKDNQPSMVDQASGLKVTGLGSLCQDCWTGSKRIRVILAETITDNKHTMEN